MLRNAYSRSTAIRYGGHGAAIANAVYVMEEAQAVMSEWGT